MTVFLTIFVTVFLAELGDKTQLATVLFAADSDNNRAFVFLAAALALIASTGLAVLFGMAAGKWLTAVPLDLVAGLGFIAIGLWTLYGHFSS